MIGTRVNVCCQEIKYFRPFRTAYHLPFCGKTKVKLLAGTGTAININIYVVHDQHEQFLLEEQDAIIGLGIVKLNPKEAVKAVPLDKQVATIKENLIPSGFRSPRKRYRW